MLFCAVTKGRDQFETKYKKVCNFGFERKDNCFDIVPLDMSIIYDDYDLVKELIHKGADVNTKGPAKNTPLIFAVVKKKYSLVALLLEEGARVDDQNLRGCTALMYAAKRNDLKMIGFLMTEPPGSLRDIDVAVLKNNDGDTALDIFMQLQENIFSFYDEGNRTVKINNELTTVYDKIISLFPLIKDTKVRKELRQWLVDTRRARGTFLGNCVEKLLKLDPKQKECFPVELEEEIIAFENDDLIFENSQ